MLQFIRICSTPVTYLGGELKNGEGKHKREKLT